MMQYKAVLFDLDGTLIDTADDIGDAANRVLSNRGFPTHSISTYRFYLPWRHSYRHENRRFCGNVSSWSAVGVSLFRRIKGKWGACRY